MAYVALYRKYRPTSWDKVYGQKAIVQTLQNQIISGRIGHAYLLSGPRGTGKTTVAKIFASAANCASPANGNSCGNCASCQATMSGYNTDIIEVDAASNNGVDNVRQIIDESKYLPQNGKYRVYIIDEVHMLSQSAFNALLKTLEEPSPGVIFILATTDVNKVPATIYSRCQHYQFRLVTVNEISTVLKEICEAEAFGYDDDAIEYIAKLANGGMRDAISILDQCINVFGNKVNLEGVKSMYGEIEDEVVATIADCVDNRDSAKVFEIIDDQVQKGRDLSSICSKLYNYFKDKFIFNPKDALLQRNVNILGNMEEKMRWNKSRTTFEVGILSMCNPTTETDFASLAVRMSEMEQLLKQLMTGLSTLGTPYSMPTMTTDPTITQLDTATKPVEIKPDTSTVRPMITFTIVKRPMIVKAFQYS